MENESILVKSEKAVEDDFKDILRFSEKSLKEVWDNKSDDIWNKK